MVKLYSTHCPMCRLVEQKLKEKNINYEEETNVDNILKLGFSHVPLLEINNKIYDNLKDILAVINSL